MTQNVKGSVSPTRVYPQTRLQETSSPESLKPPLKPGVESGPDPVTAQVSSLIDDGTAKEAERAFDGLLRSLEFKASPNGAGASTSVKQKIGGPPAPIKFVGMVLGRNQSNEEVRVKREVGAPAGYADKWQAMAVARLGKAEHAVVVQDPKTKNWHAFETTADFQAGPVANTTQGLTVIGMPPLADIKHWSRKVQELNKTLDTMKQSGADESAIDKTRKDLKDAQLKLAAATLGVPESDIVFIAKSADRKAGKINITEQDNPKSLGRTGSVGGGTLDGFQQGKDSAIEIDLADLLANPTGGQVTLFHEMVHLKHHELAQEWVKKYPGSIVMDPPQAFDVFRKWIDSQKDLTKADKELIVNVVQGNDGTTEALANVQSFLAALQAGSPDQAKKELVKYANALLPGRVPGYANPANGSQVLAALTKELQTAYRQMPKAMQDQFDDAMKAAQQVIKSEADKRKAENKLMPDLWISSLKFSR